MDDTADQSFDATSAPDSNRQLVRDQDAATKDTPAVPEDELALIKEWQKKILAARDKFEPDFKKMRENMEFARYGSKKDYKGYRVPLTARHINQKVSQLYARKPTVSADVQRKVLFKLWDEDPNTFMAALQKIEEAMAAGLDPTQVAPNETAIIQEVAAVKQQELLSKRMAKTAEIVADYFIKPRAFKRRMKQMVRRGCTTKVGYVDLGWQREMTPNPQVVAQIDGHLSQIRRMESLAAELKEGEIDENSADMARLKSLVADLQKAPQVIVKEGPVFDFPRSFDVIVDPDCVQLHGFDGANWLVRQYPPMKPRRVKDLFGKDIEKYTPYKQGISAQDSSKNTTSSGEDKGDVCVWRVQDKELGQEFFIADGYEGWLKPPAEPEMLLDRFFTLFSYVPNDIEDDKDLYPPSDVEWMESAQNEMNDIRQRLHEHRIAAIPGYVSGGGSMDEDEKTAIMHRSPFGVTTLKQLQSGMKVREIFDTFPVPIIDPSVYNDKPVMDDVLRSVGAQDANFGPPQSNTTATSSSIAENSRMSASGSSIDDLDDLLTEIVECVNEANLLYLSPKTVQEIAGPNAVWPDQTTSRVEAVKRLTLRVQAGSSGRLNAAATLANMERAAPFLVQIPNMNMMPFARKYCETLEIPVEEMEAEGAPSVVALNAMMSKAAAAGGQAQGGGAPQPGPEDSGRQPGPQAAHPAPSGGVPGAAGPGRLQ